MGSRIAYVCRDLDPGDAGPLTGAGAAVLAAAHAMAAAGHDVCLVSEAPAPAGHSGPAPRWVPVRPARAGHRYFADEQAHADRVCDTLRALHRDGPLDAVEFADPADAVTTLRAARLLGEFAGTALLVRPGPAAGPEAASLDGALAAHLRRYGRDHADAVVDGAAGPLPASLPPLAEPLPGAALTAWYLGDARPGPLDTLLRATELVLDTEPGFRVLVAGDDTATDPFGRSYWRHLTRTLPPAVRAACLLAGPPRAGDPGTLPAPGNQCLPDGRPATAALAAALGCAVLDPAAGAGGLAAALRDGIRRAADPRAAAELLAGARAERLARHPSRAAATLAAAYRAAANRPAPPPAGDELVSVVIPLYDQGEYLADAVESVRRSSYPHVEIVVVDDGSTDRATIDAFDALDGVRKVRQRNAGLSAARNAGIRAATGRYLLPLDADDLLPPDFLRVAVGALRRAPDLAYVGGYLRYFGLLDLTHVPVGHVPDVSTVVNTHVRATALFRREAVEAVGGYDEALPAFEDWDLHLSLAAAGHRSDILPVEGHRYRRHTDSMTFSSSNAMRLELLQYLLRKHAGGGHERLLLLLAELWKTGYEPSASVRWQQAREYPVASLVPVG